LHIFVFYNLFIVSSSSPRTTTNTFHILLGKGSAHKKEIQGTTTQERNMSSSTSRLLSRPFLFTVFHRHGMRAPIGNPFGVHSDKQAWVEVR
jgi:hypothetical protein